MARSLYPCPALASFVACLLTHPWRYHRQPPQSSSTPPPIRLPQLREDTRYELRGCQCCDEIMRGAITEDICRAGRSCFGRRGAVSPNPLPASPVLTSPAFSDRVPLVTNFRRPEK
ncbi:hypothetical protein FIBSPDRAFT_867945 [Athelia psychrophila]|uniref:Uncharacterized protein n=1 Tax=Athelia psychrophila TaxID=1759441 RepID=A0A166DK67_9AGAM|nr:hypothetical protein FIBSPDRAFT_867945 [Fibularhizoctonia sp. CBS 109695]